MSCDGGHRTPAIVLLDTSLYCIVHLWQICEWEQNGWSAVAVDHVTNANDPQGFGGPDRYPARWRETTEPITK